MRKQILRRILQSLFIILLIGDLCNDWPYERENKAHTVPDPVVHPPTGSILFEGRNSSKNKFRERYILEPTEGHIFFNCI